MSLLDDILVASRSRLEERKRSVPLADVRARAADAPRGAIAFGAALEQNAFSLIAEIKRRSPSSGPMDDDNVASALALYDTTPTVSAISILTDEDHFGQSLAHLENARRGTGKPLLRKDFILDAYQVWEARAAGADAILLMAGLLGEEPTRAADLHGLARSLGMDVLFELGMYGTDIEEQARLVPPEATVWGINSRRFKTSKLKLRSTLGSLVGKELSIESEWHEQFRRLVPEGKVAVAESGIARPEDLEGLAALDYRAALVGTAFLKKGARGADVVAGFDAAIQRLRARAAPEAQPPGGTGTPVRATTA